MHSTGSILWSILDGLADHFDEAFGQGKYTPQDIVNKFVQPAIASTWSMVQMVSSAPVVMRMPLALNKDQADYQLPPNVGEVRGIYLMSKTGPRVIVGEVDHRTIRSASSPVWRLEGSMLRFDPPPTADVSDVELWYIPTGDVWVHYHDGTNNLGEVLTSTTFKATMSPSLGLFDRRENAYLGCYLRILNGATGVWEERIITAQSNNYNAGTATLTVRNAMTTAVGGGIKYEIAPMEFSHAAEAVKQAAAVSWGVALGRSEKFERQHSRLFASAAKAVSDRVTNMDGVLHDHFTRDDSRNVEALTVWPS